MEELFKVLLLQPRRVLATSFFDCQMARIIWILVEVTFNMYNSSDWSSPSFLWLATGTREETKRQALVGACAICYLDKVFSTYTMKWHALVAITYYVSISLQAMFLILIFKVIH